MLKFTMDIKDLKTMVEKAALAVKKNHGYRIWHRSISR